MLRLTEYDKNILEMKYLMSIYPIAIVFRDNGRHVSWSDDDKCWCFYIDGEPSYIICEDFHQAMQ